MASQSFAQLICMMGLLSIPSQCSCLRVKGGVAHTFSESVALTETTGAVGDLSLTAQPPLSCYCTLTQRNCKDIIGNEGKTAVYNQDLAGKGAGCCVRYKRCPGSANWEKQDREDLCDYDEHKHWKAFLESIKHPACKAQLTAYPRAIKKQCDQFEYHGHHIQSHDCHRFAEKSVYGLFINPSRLPGVCEFLTKFRNMGYGTGASLMLWCLPGEGNETVEQALESWSQVLQAYNDWQTRLNSALNDKAVSNMDRCDKAERFIQVHWGGASTCLLTQPTSQDMLHFVVGRKLCPSGLGRLFGESQEKCFEETFMKRFEVDSAGASGNFFAVQVWALTKKGVFCKTLMPVLIQLIEKSDLRGESGNMIWNTVNYMACADVDRRPSQYIKKQPVGDCFAMPFGVETSGYGWNRCKNLRPTVQRTQSGIRLAVNAWLDDPVMAKKNYGPISYWNVAQITDMSRLFSGKNAFNADLNAWNVSGVTDMRDMFNGATAFNRDLSAWDVSNVTTMEGMFAGASRFNGDLSAWNVGAVTDMSHMFLKATAFNADLNAWNVGNVKAMSGMFYHARSFNGDLNAWNVSNVEDMYSMFRGASAFNGDLSAWNVSALTHMDDMKFMF